MSELYKALHAIQAETTTLQKNAINDHFGNSYISLDQLMEAILPLLNSHGVILLQAPGTVDGVPSLATTLIHVETGDEINSVMSLMLDKNTPQGQGSAITYARRYSLMSLLALVADVDDDGERAEGRGKEAKVNIKLNAKSSNGPSF